MGSAPWHSKITDQYPAERYPNAKVGRLGDYRGIGTKPAFDTCDCSHARRLFISHSLDDQITEQVNPIGGESLVCGEEAGNSTLHVACSPSVDTPVHYVSAPGVVSPVSQRAWRDGVNVPIEY